MRFAARVAILVGLSAGVPLFAQERPKVELQHGEELLVIEADRIETEAGETLVAEGNVIATYGDVTLTAERALYRGTLKAVLIEGNIEIRQGVQWLNGTRAELDLENDTGVIYDVSGYTDESLYIQAETLTKTGPEVYVAEKGYVTSCVDAVPKWSFKVNKAEIRVNSTVRLSNTLFRVKNAPIFYFPYMIYPTGRKERSSGFLLPTIGNSRNKGRRVSAEFYLVLGRSADLTLQEDYYSKRGFAHGFTFRARPNQVSFLELTGYGIDDRLGQGGASLDGLGETFFGNGFRAAADFSLVTDFTFRQVFSDNFFTATSPTESSRFFLARSDGNRYFDVRVNRQEMVFPKQNAVTQALPEMAFRIGGERLGSSPFYLDLRSSIGAVSRTDAEIETPPVSQRLDLHPVVHFSLPLLGGLRLSPHVGFRETFYSDSKGSEDGKVTVSGKDQLRQYVDLGLDLKGFGIARVYGKPGENRWKHLIEPTLRYQYISGIDEFDQILRFDDLDPIANTSELEYALYNRFFAKRKNGQSREILSIRLAQKYFFDPSFSGALVEGRINQFFPLYTLTGYPYATNARPFSPINAVARLSPTGPLAFDVRGDFDTVSGGIRDFSVTGLLQRDWYSAAATYFVADEILPGAGKSNQIQARVGIGELSRGLSLVGGFSYDSQADRFLHYLARLSYYWDCCGASVEVYGFNIDVRQERQIRFSFSLKGIGTFGTIRRPDQVF